MSKDVANEWQRLAACGLGAFTVKAYLFVCYSHRCAGYLPGARDTDDQ